MLLGDFKSVYDNAVILLKPIELIKLSKHRESAARCGSGWSRLKSCFAVTLSRCSSSSTGSRIKALVTSEMNDFKTVMNSVTWILLCNGLLSDVLN